MKIVILDGYTTNPGDLSWQPLAALGSLTVYDHRADHETKARCLGADVIVSCRAPLSAALLDEICRFSKPKLITTLSTGYNHIDLSAAARNGITVTNAPLYSTDSVAQHTFALILALCNHTGKLAASSSHTWIAAETASQTDFCLQELSGKALGILGYGSIGQRVSTIGRAFGMDILVHSRHQPSVDWIHWVDRRQLFLKSDILSLHCPLNEETVGMVNASLLSLMKPGAYLINTARGGIINEQALANALNNGALAGAGLDVLSQEPPPTEHPLLSAKNCLITPHISWSSKAARQRLIHLTAENIQAYISGKPVHVVSPSG